MDNKEAGFSKWFVMNQLRYKGPRKLDRAEMDIYVSRIKELWEKTSPVISERPKFILVDFMSNVKPFHVLVSEFSQHYWPNSRVSMDILLVRYHGAQLTGMPVPTLVMSELGGHDIVGRMMTIGGLEYVLSNFKNKNESEGIKTALDGLKKWLDVEKKGIGL